MADKMTEETYFDARPMDKSTADGTLKTARYQEEAQKKVDEKAENVSAKPATAPASDEVKTDPPEEKEINEYTPHADNDSEFKLKPLDDETNVEAGKIMENQARAPAHQQHELAVEEDAPGFEQAAALMTPRGNEHYNEGGSVAEVNAGRSFGEA